MKLFMRCDLSLSWTDVKVITNFTQISFKSLWASKIKASRRTCVGKCRLAEFHFHQTFETEISFVSQCVVWQVSLKLLSAWRQQGHVLGLQATRYAKVSPFTEGPRKCKELRGSHWVLTSRWFAPNFFALFSAPQMRKSQDLLMFQC